MVIRTHAVLIGQGIYGKSSERDVNGAPRQRQEYSKLILLCVHSSIAFFCVKVSRSFFQNRFRDVRSSLYPESKQHTNSPRDLASARFVVQPLKRRHELSRHRYALHVD